MMACHKHGVVEEAFIACVHVCQGAPIAHVQEPHGAPPAGLGELLCEACAHGDDDPPIEDLKVICSVCAAFIRTTRVAG
jgi:hypothetical protein